VPYIAPEKRQKFEIEMSEFPSTPGELNYVITEIILGYIVVNKRGDISYTTMNEIIGVLECIKQELYRRVLAPYENEKIVLNGDLESFAYLKW